MRETLKTFVTVLSQLPYLQMQQIVYVWRLMEYGVITIIKDHVLSSLTNSSKAACLKHFCFYVNPSSYSLGQNTKCLALSLSFISKVTEQKTKKNASSMLLGFYFTETDLAPGLRMDPL